MRSLKHSDTDNIVFGPFSTLFVVALCTNSVFKKRHTVRVWIAYILYVPTKHNRLLSRTIMTEQKTQFFSW